jgi:hypothetical protein
MSDKNVTASGPGSIAIGGSANYANIRTNASGVKPFTTPGAPSASGGGVHASAPASIAVGRSIIGSTVHATYNGLPTGPTPDGPVAFAELQSPVDLMLRIAKIGPEEIRIDARARDGRQIGPFKTQIGKADAFASKLGKLQRRRLWDPNVGFVEINDKDESSAFNDLFALGETVASLLPKELIGGEDTLLTAVLNKTSPTILILTDEAFIPWELAVLPAGTTSDDKPRFLSELAAVGRWPLGGAMEAPPEKLSIGAFHAFAATTFAELRPESDIPDALKERDHLVATYKAIGHDATLPEISAWLKSPQTGEDAVHMALHGYHDPVGGHGGLILQDGGVLDPNHLLGVGATERSPRKYSLVFLHACQTGGGSESLGRLDGFPGALARRGAGAIVAPLWEVDDAKARTFTERFYDMTLSSAMPVGVALRKLRQGETGGVDRFAYVFYGHPRLALERG